MMPSLIDLNTFREWPLVIKPFPYLIIPGFIKTEFLGNVIEDFPKIDKPGSFPLTTLEYGETFSALINELESKMVGEAFSDKFGINLNSRPTMITARGICRTKDGQIHADSRNKIITVLLYFNTEWERSGGRLRLLRSPDNLEDTLAEINPDAGTMLAFLNTENAWHGHAPFEGVRRVIQLNWVTEQRVVDREQKRHRISAFFKKINPF